MKKHVINGIEIILKNNAKTPRVALVCNFLINKEEKYAGIRSLYTKLLMQGTKKYSAVELSKLIEDNGIELNIKCKQDNLTACTLCLNEDFELAVDILGDVLQNSTFDEFEKEVHKLKGEITSELDEPRLLATDKFVRKIFENHYYSNSYSKILEELDKISKEDMFEISQQFMNSKKVITVVGDIQDEEKLLNIIAEKLAFMENYESEDEIPVVNKIQAPTVDFIAKDDLAQAQVLKGVIVPTFTHEDYPKIIVMNNILGSAGLSSRLFVELRDKKGLAYTVRSSYEPMIRGAILYFYIACDPSNIQKSLDEFDIEVKKLQTTPITEAELQGAKENVIGRLEYFSQTNMQQALMISGDYLLGLGLDWEEKYRKMINDVTIEDVQHAAHYFNSNSITVALAKSEYKI
ncbi:insulinase family protein [bacterium]|nr:insulinase family protein [bacterium]